MVLRNQNVWKTCRTSLSPASKITSLAAVPTRCGRIICPDFWGSYLSSELCARRASSASSTLSWKTWFLLHQLWKKYSRTRFHFECEAENGSSVMSVRELIWEPKTECSDSIRLSEAAKHRRTTLSYCAASQETCSIESVCIWSCDKVTLSSFTRKLCCLHHGCERPDQS